MHGFWRASISVAVGSATAGWLSATSQSGFPGNYCFELLKLIFEFFGDPPFANVGGWVHFVAVALTFGFVPTLLAVATHATLSRLAPKPKSKDERETRCRKCEYILRGITEPRCPECGELI